MKERVIRTPRKSIARTQNLNIPNEFRCKAIAINFCSIIYCLIISAIYFWSWFVHWIEPNKNSLVSRKVNLSFNFEMVRDSKQGEKNGKREQQKHFLIVYCIMNTKMSEFSHKLLLHQNRYWLRHRHRHNGMENKIWEKVSIHKTNSTTWIR